jgi:predicted TPR repeat methyltransferase
MTPDQQGPNEFVAEAYALEDKESILSFYRKWARDYDQQMLSQGYSSPRDISRLLAAHLDDPAAVILDIGCGTGLTGREITDAGFTVVDGADISGEMIAVARSREIYRRLFVMDLNEPLAFTDDAYDAIVSSGTFTHGHVGPGPLPELIRVLRPGGLLACTVHFDLWHSRGFDAMFARLMSDGLIECIDLSEGPYYTGGENSGWFCVYRKKAKQR